jgi:hypothetical protein
VVRARVAERRMRRVPAAAERLHEIHRRGHAPGRPA